MTPGEYQQVKQEVMAEIEGAFDGVERGIGTTLHEAYAIEARANLRERLAACRKDTDTRWQDIAEADLPRIAFVFNFMNPAGFRYYLPAYLLWYLKDMDEPMAFDPLDMFYMFLQGGAIGSPDFHHQSQFSLLNAEQARAVAHFLEFQVTRAAFCFDEAEEEGADGNETWLAERNEEIRFWSSGAQEALASYWGQFLL